MIRSVRGVNMALCGLLAAATTGFVLSDKVAIAGYSNCPDEIGTIGNGAQCAGSPSQTPLGTDCQAGTDAYNRSYCCLYRTIEYRCGDRDGNEVYLGVKKFLQSETLNGTCSYQAGGTQERLQGTCSGGGGYPGYPGY